MRRSRAVLAAALGYLVGTFPTADLVTRRVSGGRVDLRAAGSGNPGGANALQVLGTRAGVAIIAGDIAKGALGSVAGGAVAGPLGRHVGATASVVGHCLPVWNGGRGGKGVGTSVGQCLATFPAYFPIDLAVAAASASSARWKRRAAAATMISSACWVAGGIVWWRRQLPNLWGPRPTAALPVAAAASSAVIAYRFATAVAPPAPAPAAAGGAA